MKKLVFIISILMVGLFGCEKDSPIANEVINDSEEMVLKESIGFPVCLRIFDYRGPKCKSGMRVNCACVNIIIALNYDMSYNAFKDLFYQLDVNQDDEAARDVVVDNQELLEEYISSTYLNGVINRELSMDLQKNIETDINYLIFMSEKTDTSTVQFVYPITLKDY